MASFPSIHDEKDIHALADFRQELQACLGKSDCPKLAEGSLSHLKERLTDSDCLRFVRARKYDVGKAVQMAIKWSEVGILKSAVVILTCSIQKCNTKCLLIICNNINCWFKFD